MVLDQLAPNCQPLLVRTPSFVQFPLCLRNIAHVVLAPHIGSATAATRQAMADLAGDNLRLVLGGQGAKTPVPECQ